MPELPEVQNMVTGLQPCINSSISSVYLSGKNLRYPINHNFAQLVQNNIITNIERLAKYICIFLSNNKVILAHAGMSGRFSLTKNTFLEKHDHMVLYLDNNYLVKYNDTRRFGLVHVLNKSDYLSSKFLKNLGLDALSKEFTAIYLQDKLKNIKSNIKNTLLNQRIVAGIGNIYASEALYDSQVNPQRNANSLTIEELQSLIQSIKRILLKSITLGGSTLKDYRKANGEKGDFQNHFLVYGKEGKPCPKCSRNSRKNTNCEIQRIVQNGRTTFYCLNTQKP